MKKIVKIILIVIAVIVLLMVIAIAAMFVYFSKPERYKPVIQKVVYDATSRDLHLNGDIKFSIYPYIGFHIGNASLSNPKDFTPPDMIKFDSADLSIRLLPLLSGSVIIDKLAFNGLNINLIKKSATQNNWTFTPTAKYSALESSTPVANGNSKKVTTVVTQNNQVVTKVDASGDKSNNRQKPMVLELKSFALNNASISYDDLTTKTHKSLANFMFKIDTSYGGIIKIDVTKQEVLLDKANINFNDILTSNINFSLNDFAKPKYKGEVNIPEFSINKLLDKLNLNTPQPKPLLNKFALQTNFSGDTSNAKLNITKFAFGSLLYGKANLSVDNLSKPNYNAVVNITSNSLRSLLQSLNMWQGKGKIKSLDKFNLDATVKGNMQKANLNIGKFNYADNLKGNLNLNVSDISAMNYTGDINVPTFSLNDFMTSMGMAEINLPNKTLLDKVSIQAKVKGSKVNAHLSPVTLNLANDKLTGQVDIKSFTPLAITENLLLDNAEISDFVNIRGYKLPIRDVKLSGSASFDSQMTIPAGINAKQNLNISNATLHGFSITTFISQVDDKISSSTKAFNNSTSNAAKISSLAQVAKSVNDIKSTLNRQMDTSKKDLSKQTDLGQVQVHLIMNKGVVNPSSFSVNGPNLRVDGSGSVNLNNKNIDYKVNTRLTAKQKNDLFNTIVFPYKIQGNFDNTSGVTDWGSIQQQLTNYYLNKYKAQLEAKATAEIKKQATKQLDNLKDKLKDNAGKIFKGLF